MNAAETIWLSMTKVAYMRDTWYIVHSAYSASYRWLTDADYRL